MRASKFRNVGFCRRAGAFSPRPAFPPDFFCTKELSIIVHLIADLHLGASVNKPMQVFGPEWDNHTEKIRREWLARVDAQDTVFLPGDLSWGIDLQEALADILFLDALPGKKILSKGNHD